MWRNHRGVTFLEIILVMVIMGILGAIIAGPVIIGAKAWSDMSRQTEIAQQARIGLDRFVRELRSIQRVNGRPSIKEVASNRIRFVTAAGDDLTYCWNDTVNCDVDPTHSTWLVRKTWLNDTTEKDRDVAAMGTQNFVLTYYEDSNASIQMRQEAETAPVTCGGVACPPTADATASGGNLVVLETNGATISYQFTGTRIAWMGPRDIGLGTAEIWIDNPLMNLPSTATVTQNATAPAPGAVLFLSAPLSYGSHTITIRCGNPLNADCSATPVKVDAFDLLVSRVVIGLTVGEGDCNTPPNLCTQLRDQISFRTVQ